MEERRRTYRRIENVLARDTLRVSSSSIDEMRRDIVKTLENYMKVYDMHVSFRRLRGGEYAIKIEGIVGGATLPKMI